MRISMLATLIATTGVLFANAANGQQGSMHSVRRAEPASRTAFEYKRISQPEADASPSDKAPVAQGYYDVAATPHAAPAAAPACCDNAADSCCDNGQTSCCDNGASSCCSNGCNNCGCCHDWCDLGEPWVLFDDCCLKKNNITITGWVDQGFTWNPDYPTDRFNGPQTFNDRANEYQMNQLYVYAEKATSTEDCCWDVGWRIDALYGTDWRTTPALGLELERDTSRNWNGDHRFYGLALPQFYAQLQVNDLIIKAGKFYTPIGYEVVTSTGNFFYSHAYTHQYGEPFTHTGVLATFAYTDQITVLGGVHRGWDQFEDFNDDLGALGGVTWTSCDKKTSVAYAASYSDEVQPIFGGTGDQGRYVQSLIFTRQVNDKLKYVAHSDYGFQNRAIGNAQDAEWYSITQYLVYQVNDCLSYGVRYEWFRDDDGFRVAGFGSGLEPAIGFQGFGYAGDFQDITVGANYKPHANLLLRPEVRWDWYSGANGVNRARPFDFGQDSSQFTAAIDAIFTF